MVQQSCIIMGVSAVQLETSCHFWDKWKCLLLCEYNEVSTE